jgi:fluoroacetyl-CoA thioesterase
LWRKNARIYFIKYRYKETDMLQAGIKGKKEITVTLDKTAKAMGSGTMDVFATPAMIALMENTAFESVAPELEEGSGTVGTALDIKHVSATPVGMKVTCESELVKVDGRALTFSVKAFDEAGLIGEGTHERFIVFEEKFQKKADDKAK